MNRYVAISSDLLYQLSQKELESLRSRFATSSSRAAQNKTLCLYGTRHRDALKRPEQQEGHKGQYSDHADLFVKLRERMASHKDLARKLEELEKKYDSQFQIVFEAIRQLIAGEEKAERKIGYISESKAAYKTARKR